MTNREWLESLSDEDMAKFLNTTSLFMCTYTKAILQWLQEKHKETDDD